MNIICFGLWAETFLTLNFSAVLSILNFVCPRKSLRLKKFSKIQKKFFWTSDEKFMEFGQINRKVVKAAFPCREEHFAPNKSQNKRIWILIFIRPVIINYLDFGRRFYEICEKWRLCGEDIFSWKKKVP